MDQTFIWPSGQIHQTLGPTGDFAGSRPVQLDDSTYFRDPSTNVSYDVLAINQQQYDGIAVKTVTSTYPQVYFVNTDYENYDIYVYPVPTRDLEWHFISRTGTRPARRPGRHHLDASGLSEGLPLQPSRWNWLPNLAWSRAHRIQRIAMTSEAGI